MGMTTMTPTKVTPVRPISSEEPPDIPPGLALKKGLIRTHTTPAVAWGMIAVFLLLVGGLPLAQLAAELARGQRPQVLDLFAGPPTQAHLHGWEDDLEKASWAKGFFRPLLQDVVSTLGGFGNTNVVVGRDGWLFYRPGADYLIGPGILDETRLDQRRRDMIENGEPHPHPDPRPAILQFHRQCAAAGARLVLVPVPDKVLLQPARLSARLTFAQPVPPPNNADFPRLVEELRQQGVDVYDPTPAMLMPDDVRFLAQDTHWTPEWMETVALDLAAHIKRSAALDPKSGHDFRIESQDASRVGDLVDMLNVSANSRAFAPQTTGLRRVVHVANGLPWHPRPDADVLLLGDSFTNIFSADAMGWGDAAGFAEHLSFNLQRPVDRISRNDAGAHATRQILSNEMARGKNRLAGKKVVIWQFAVRELTCGDWKPINMTVGAASPRRFLVPEPGKERLVTGVVEMASTAPRPGTVPYKDHIITVHLTDLEDAGGPIPGGQAVVYMWSMKNNVWTPAARYRPEQRITVRLRPWSDVAEKLEAINRRELNNDELDLEEHCWAEEVVP